MKIMPELEAPINPNGKQEIPKPSEAMIDTPLEGPLACNCDQALLLLELLAQARETITKLREELRDAKNDK
jgi:hypothetical protein